MVSLRLNIIIVLVLLPYLISAQNLVLNPSFEEYHFCQNNNFLYDATDFLYLKNKDIRFFAKNWSVNCQSPDFYCSQCPDDGVENLIEPHSGKAYIGFGGTAFGAVSV